MAYCVRTDVEDVYGQDNIFDWADINGDGDVTQVDDRITWAIEKADRRIDARLQRRGYELSFTTVPGIIVDVSAEYAGYYLYASRMLDSDDRTKNNLSHMKKDADDTLNMIISGQIKLSQLIDDYTDAPFVENS